MFSPYLDLPMRSLRSVQAFASRRAALRAGAKYLIGATLAMSAASLPFLAIHSAAAAEASAAIHPKVVLQTTDGNITLELFPEKAPKTVANFLTYVKEGHYAGTIFHRVIPGFMIQGGGFDKQLHETATHAPIPLESRNGLHNTAGTIAMARTSDPNSATAQFFINTVDNANLDYPNPDGNGYAVFGRVSAGMGVVKQIEKTPTGTGANGMQDVPTTPIVIESAHIE